ncbi:hypothetical protein EUTSA_v10009791mg [Eutrema salsugineum]|uniref:Transmembrane protein n=1 Tax=Eutrema salsugineum TaxID=72664 RepID=V4KC05_EUTSA|nr:uncharacterized protein LOC18993314 [Eutrema salsugineum]ESQ35245.1 hypothetical protein EUTSA_v10009791mg [Eutrema salsugineum]
MEGPLLTKDERNVDVTRNGDSSSDDEHNVNITINDDFSSTVAQIPYVFAFILNSCELVVTLVQIVAAIVVVTGTKGDHTEATWINVYTCGCIANVLILCWRFCNYQNATSETGINSVMIILKMILEYFFVGWSVVFLWVFVGNSSLDHTIPLSGLCVTFLVFSFLRYVLPNLICAAMCCCMSVTLGIRSIS